MRRGGLRLRRVGAASLSAGAFLSAVLPMPSFVIFGVAPSGVQAGSHLEALRLVRAFTEVRVWSPRRAEEFARQHGVRASQSAEEAVRGANVVVVATSSRTPVLRREWLVPGAPVNTVGSGPDPTGASSTTRSCMTRGSSWTPARPRCGSPAT